MMCKNKISQFVLKGYNYKEIKVRCGSTGIYGQQLLCEDCADKYQRMYPQGWRNVPGDICVHGNHIGDSNGPDHLCAICEEE
jgi:hypothetical protein